MRWDLIENKTKQICFKFHFLLCCVKVKFILATLHFWLLWEQVMLGGAAPWGSLLGRGRSSGPHLLLLQDSCARQWFGGEKWSLKQTRELVDSGEVLFPGHLSALRFLSKWKSYRDANFQKVPQHGQRFQMIYHLSLGHISFYISTICRYIGRYKYK